MKLYEKIKNLRKEKKLKLTELHRRIQAIFENKALTYRTLQRIENGQTDSKTSSLYQICLGLGINFKDLYEGVEEDLKAKYIKKNESQGKYIYNKDACAEILTDSKVEFLALRLLLQPEGKTKPEEDPKEEIKFKKWVYVLRGELTCIVGDQKFIIKKDDSLSFDSSLTHHFENNSAGETHCLIIQNPRCI